MEFIDISLTNKPYEMQVKEAINRVLESGNFIGGEEVDNFEQEFASYIGVKHVISCASGTDAIFLALKALGIGKGDEVIVPSFTYVATANTVTNVGATPVFCDVDEKTFNIDVSSAAEKITPNTKAIIPVHLFGQSSNMEAITALATKHGIYVIEDAAQSTGATFNGKQTGSMGTVGCFSFFPTKNLGCYGDGGAISTSSNEIAEKLRKLKHQGQSKKYYHEIIGYNSRLDTLQAAILRVKLPFINKEISARRKKAEEYNKTLQNVIIPFEDKKCFHTFNQYTILVENRDEYQNELTKQGVPSMVYYPLPLHLQPCFNYLGYKNGDLPVSEHLCKQVLSLPIIEKK